MNRMKRFVAAATLSAGLLVQAAIVPTTVLRPALAAAQATKPAAAATATATPAPVVVPAQNAAPAPAPAPVPQPNGKVIFIDPGHGGSDAGALHEDASGHADLTEKDVNLAIALKLADMLRQQGYTVQMSRTTDVSPAPNGSVVDDLQARVDEANKAGADLFICIHNNASSNPAARGTDVYYCSDRPFSADSLRLAKLVDQALASNLQKAGYSVPNYGVKDDASMGHFAVLAPANLDRPTKMPGILGESLYMSNDQDAAHLRDPSIQAAIARGYFEGIQAYFGHGQP